MHSPSFEGQLLNGLKIKWIITDFCHKVLEPLRDPGGSGKIQRETVMGTKKEHNHQSKTHLCKTLTKGVSMSLLHLHCAFLVYRLRETLLDSISHSRTHTSCTNCSCVLCETLTCSFEERQCIRTKPSCNISAPLLCVFLLLSVASSSTGLFHGLPPASHLHKTVTIYM